jgi:DNA-binding response OmpR family regulator
MESKKIMVVEDEKLTMLFIMETLEEYGYERIFEYTSAQEIINAIREGNRPDLILMDINIKGAKDGIQTAKEILNFCDVPIVFMSAYNDKRTIKEVLDVSLYGFLSKPFNERELYIALEIAWKQFEEHKCKKETEAKCRLHLYENCFYDLKTNNVYLDNSIVFLPNNQKILLETLVTSVNSIVDKELLSYKIWTTKEESKSALRTVVYLLRKKLNGIQISSQSKQGYLLKASPF